MVAAIVVDELAHSLCDVSSVVIFVLDDLVDGDSTYLFGWYRSLTAFAACVGGWVSGWCVDRCDDVELALILSVLGTALGYGGMFVATTRSLHRHVHHRHASRLHAPDICSNRFGYE